MTPRQFATDVVRQLRAAGYEAVWAGGCVRDQLLGREPKDYDVATNAAPTRVRRLFGHHRTLAVGAAFGVIALLGPPGAGTVEIVTFRSDDKYSDGRHPDRVTFGSAREDALRRDFTINGLFYDPLNDEVIDYVGGRADIERRLIRAIGDPQKRIAEDKLRMLRAIRFAATFDFTLDDACLAAIRSQSAGITCVSAERISAELRLMLRHRHRRRAAQLLVQSLLLPVLLPEGVAAYRWHLQDPHDCGGNPRWHQSLNILHALGEIESLAPAWAALLRGVAGPAAKPRTDPRSLIERWRLTNDEVEGLAFVLDNEELILTASARPWPQVQRILTAGRAGELLQYCEAVSQVEQRGVADLAFCRAKTALPQEEWNPAPLITGHDLQELDLPRGPIYRHLLHAVRDAQLNGQLQSRDEALNWVRMQLQNSGQLPF